MPSKMKFNADGKYNGKKDIVRELSKAIGIPMVTVEKVLDAFLHKVKDDILKKRIVHLTGIGTIDYKNQRRRVVSNLSNKGYGTYSFPYPKIRWAQDLMRRFMKRYRIIEEEKNDA